MARHKDAIGMKGKTNIPFILAGIAQKDASGSFWL
jgi:hypothetical protein